MTQLVDREVGILSNAIIEDVTGGDVEVFADHGELALTASSGTIYFDDANTSGFIRFSESGDADIITVNGKKSIVGLLNLVPRFWVSANDTTADYAENKIVTVSGITVTVLNEGGNEQLEIGVNASALADVIESFIEHNALDGLQGGVGGEYYHLTAQQLIDLTSGVFADNQHLHNASAITVDDGDFDIVSGTNLQDVLDVIDELLKTRNTLLVNFDIGGSVKNGNVRMAIDDDVATLRFNANTLGIAAFTNRIPENYFPGTDLIATIKWYSQGAGTDDVVWDVCYKSLAAGEVNSGAAVCVQQVVAEPGVAREIVETTFTIPAAAVALDDVLTITVKRRGDLGTDTSNELVSLIEVSLDY